MSWRTYNKANRVWEDEFGVFYSLYLLLRCPCKYSYNDSICQDGAACPS